MSRWSSKRKPYNYFLNEAKKIHGDVYTYPLEEYKGLNYPITITCNKHGDFTLNYARSHISSHKGDVTSCPVCKRENFLYKVENRLLKISHKKNEYKIDREEYIDGELVKPIWFNINSTRTQLTEYQKACNRMYDRVRFKRPDRKISKSINCRLRHKVIRGYLTESIVRNYNLSKSEYYLGCNIQLIRSYIEQQFEPEFKWENYGKLWEIDHMIPLGSVKEYTEENLLRLNHFTNLQPILKTENIQKSNKMIKSIIDESNKRYENWFKYKDINKIIITIKRSL